MSNDFINGLVATAEPVHRRKVGLEVFAVVAVAVIEVVGLISLIDTQILMAAYAQEPVRMTAKYTIFGLLALASMGLAIQSFNPAAKRIGVGAIAVLVAAFVAAIAFFDMSMSTSFTATVAPSIGMRCAAAVTSLALPVTLVLGILMMNGASTQPGRSAFLAGLAGGAFGAFVYALQCPQTSFWYLIAWYGGGIALVSVATMIILPRFIRW